MPQNFNTFDNNFADLTGSMTATGNNIDSYTSNNLGTAFPIVNNPAPPPVSCVLTFSNGAVYTICGRPNGRGFVGDTRSGAQTCTGPHPRNDDWSATVVLPDCEDEPENSENTGETEIK